MIWGELQDLTFSSQFYLDKTGDYGTVSYIYLCTELANHVTGNQKKKKGTRKQKSV